MVVEVCCGSLADARAAKCAGADRIELNSALCLGGLTPSIGTVRLVKKEGIPSMAMVRPRGGGFCYSDAEFETMLADAEALVDAGSEGIVFGVLLADGAVDDARCRLMMDAVGKVEAVFHMAIDCVPDWRCALDTLSALGVARVLTRGQAPTAAEGINTIREMFEYAAGRIEILAGGGVRKSNVREIIAKSGCSQVHFSLRTAPAGPDGEAPLMSEAELSALIQYVRS
jgi:copper homeostasis protein